MPSRKRIKYIKVPISTKLDIGLNYLSHTLQISRAHIAKIALGKEVASRLKSVNKELNYLKVMENLQDMNNELLETYEGRQ